MLHDRPLLRHVRDVSCLFFLFLFLFVVLLTLHPCSRARTLFGTLPALYIRARPRTYCRLLAIGWSVFPPTRRVPFMFTFFPRAVAGSSHTSLPQDPDRYATYVKQSSFLADLDNLRDTKNVTYKGHMLGLHSLTLVHRPAIAHLPCPIISLLHALRPSYRSNRWVLPRAHSKPITRFTFALPPASPSSCGCFPPAVPLTRH